MRIASFRFPRLLACRQGSVLPMIGLGLVALVGAAGIAVDTGRAQMVQSKLSMALDAAGLAAGSTVNTSNLNTEVTKYFNANYPAGYMNSTVKSVTATVSADNTTINLAASVTLPTTFMQMMGASSLTISAATQITRATSGMELVLVLDNTGSMNNPVNPANSSASKLSALQSATAELLNILYGASNNTAKNLWVGVVPFTQVVNIGTGYSGWMDGTYDATLNWGPQSWQGCVMARPGPYDVSDDPPSSSFFQAYYFPTTGTVQAPSFGSGVNGSCSGGLNPWKCTVRSNGKNVLTYDFNHSNSLGNNMGPNVECPQQVTPMVAEKNTVITAINAMKAGGDTNIDLGMAWGWRMLSPRWQGLWGGEMNTNGLPLAYNTPLMNKVVILMTDGMNHFTPGNYTAYGFLSDGRLGSTNETNAESALNTRTLQACTNMKNNGIIIYTIGFGTDDSNNPNNPTSVNGPLLKACASQASYYFLAPTNADLSSAFNMIGDSLSNLRVSQ